MIEHMRALLRRLDQLRALGSQRRAPFRGEVSWLDRETGAITWALQEAAKQHPDEWRDLLADLDERGAR